MLKILYAVVLHLYLKQCARNIEIQLAQMAKYHLTLEQLNLQFQNRKNARDKRPYLKTDVYGVNQYEWLLFAARLLDNFGGAIIQNYRVYLLNLKCYRYTKSKFYLSRLIN